MSDTKEINLLVKARSTFLTSSQFKKILTIASFLALFILIAASLELFIVGKIFQQQFSELSKNIKVAENDIQNMKEKEILLRGMSDKLTVAEKLLNAPSGVVLLFDQFRNLLLPDIAINSLELSENSLTASVSTRSLFSLESFLQNLADSQKGGKFLTDIVASSINLDQNGQYSANIGAKVKQSLISDEIKPNL